MNLSTFKNLIKDKLFISIENQQDMFEFIDLNNNSFRNAALEEGVIVFLPTINKIWARNSYYGVSESDITSIQSSLTSYGNSISELTTLLGELTGIVQGHTDTLSSYSDTISEHTLQITNILSDISDIQTFLGDIPNNKTLSTVIDELIDSSLESALGDYVTLSELTTALQNKADATEFNTFKTNLLARLNQFDNENATLETVIQNIKNSISGIPKFNIVTVENRAALNNIQNPSSSTIYIIPKTNEDDNEEVFTEFIWINKNFGKTDPETGEPLPESYGWEKLGSQVFSINTIVSKEELMEALEEIGGQIEGKAPASLESTVNQNSTAIQNIQTTLSGLQTTINSLNNALNSLNNLIDSEGNIIFTGEDIKTTSQLNSNTIAEDISSLNSTKLDIDAINWVIINNE